MMKPRSGLQMLRALLTLAPLKLSGGEKRAFQAMYDDLSNGRMIELSKKQRLWVEAAFLKHKLENKELPAREVAKVKVRDKRKPDGLLDFGPLPKKPPGRS